MKIIINNASMTPIYEQIVAQIKSMVVDSILLEGAPLPSVRTLAKELKISALTAKKAYDTLEEEGFVVTVHGKGSYISRTNVGLIEEEKKKDVEDLLEKAITDGRGCGMTNEELLELFNIILEESR